MEDIKITSETKQKNPKKVEQGKWLATISKQVKEQKNPKKVEQGKWLATISKQVKEQKARERFLAEQEKVQDIL